MKAPLRILLRLLLTATFLTSGAIKLQAPDRFLLDVEAFQFVPAWAAFAIALGLPWLEVFAALGLWWQGLARGAAFLLGMLSLGFIGILGWAEWTGLDLACGCFGDWLVFPNLATHLAFNSLLAAASGALLWADAKSRTSSRLDFHSL